MSDALIEAGESAVETALTLWREGVYDPARTDMSPAANLSRARILHLIHVGLGATWLKSYAGDGDFAWCGSLPAYSWGAAGLKEECRFTHGDRTPAGFASLYKIWNWANQDKRRIISLRDVRPGDILTVGPDSPKWGKHIVMALGAVTPRGWVSTIEGNATGLGPNGERYEGIVKRRRYVTGAYRVRCAYRPLISDLETAIE